MNINEITGHIEDAAMKVHTVPGPALLESAYELCVAHELQQRSLNVQTQVILPIQFEGLSLDAGCRIDLLVEDIVIVELKEGLKRLVNNHTGPIPRSSAPSAVNPPPDLSQKDFE